MYFEIREKYVVISREQLLLKKEIKKNKRPLWTSVLFILKQFHTFNRKNKDKCELVSWRYYEEALQPFLHRYVD